MTDVALYMLDEDYGSWPVPIFGGPYDYLVRVHTTRKRGRVVPKLDALAEIASQATRVEHVEQSIVRTHVWSRSHWMPSADRAEHRTSVCATARSVT